MVTKADARALQLGSDMRSSSGQLGTSRDGWLEVNIPPGTSSFNVALNPNYDEFALMVQGLTVSVNNVVFCKFIYPGGVTPVNASRRSITGYGTNQFASTLNTGDLAVSGFDVATGAIGLKNIKGLVTNRLNHKSLCISSDSNFAATDYVVVMHGNDFTSGLATHIQFYTSTGTINSGLIRLRTINKVS